LGKVGKQLFYHNLGMLNPNMLFTKLAFDPFLFKIAKENAYPNFSKLTYIFPVEYAISRSDVSIRGEQQ